MMSYEEQYKDFEQYLIAGEPGQREKAGAWQTAIGLQAVDGLKPSGYLVDAARKHIEGDITIEEVQRLIKSYYDSKEARAETDSDTEEADKVAANIAKILNERSFAFSVTGLTSIHRRLFDGVFKFAGKIRDYDITKKEWVLRGDTVLYVNAADLRRAIAYDLEQEKNFSYKGLSLDEVVAHIAKFVASLWQIHPFGEGNTRTVAVFTIKYLRSIGFQVNNELFAEHAWYFRNALVRANYRNVCKGIEPDASFLLLFFRNLMLGECHELKNRYMVVDFPMKLAENVAGYVPASSRQVPDKLPASSRQAPDKLPTSTRQALGKLPTSTRQVPDKLPASSRQVPDKSPTSSRQVPDKLPTSTAEVRALIAVLSDDSLSIKEMLAAMKLKDRENFMANYLNPAMKEGWVAMLYPDKPHHPRQKYRLTVKGRAVCNSLVR